MVTQIRYYHGSTVVPVVVPVFFCHLRWLDGRGTSYMN
jgi:hypothetical protein